MLIFGSYLDRSRRLTGEAVHITVLDTVVALTAGFIVIPACFAYGIELDAGPSLVFITLPNIFAQMKGGFLWNALFFLFLTFAALSTIIAVFENIIAFDMDLFGWSRKKSVAVSAVLMVVLSMPAVLGYNLYPASSPWVREALSWTLKISSYPIICCPWEALAMCCSVPGKTAGDGMRFKGSKRRRRTCLPPLPETLCFLRHPPYHCSDLPERIL